MSKAIVKTTFEASKTLQPIYTGGSTALDATGRVLLSCVGEDANLVDLETGDQLASLEGVSLKDLLIPEICGADQILLCIGWRNHHQSSTYVYSKVALNVTRR